MKRKEPRGNAARGIVYSSAAHSAVAVPHPTCTDCARRLARVLHLRYAEVA